MLPGCGQSLVGTGRGRTGRRGRLPSFFLNLRDAKRMWRSWSHAHAAGTGKRCRGGSLCLSGGREQGVMPRDRQAPGVPLGCRAREYKMCVPKFLGLMPRWQRDVPCPAAEPLPCFILTPLPRFPLSIPMKIPTPFPYQMCRASPPFSIAGKPSLGTRRGRGRLPPVSPISPWAPRHVWEQPPAALPGNRAASTALLFFCSNKHP